MQKLATLGGTASRVSLPSRSSTVLCLEPYFPSCLKAAAAGQQARMPLFVVAVA
jgi:hypothetical protein